MRWGLYAGTILVEPNGRVQKAHFNLGGRRRRNGDSAASVCSAWIAKSRPKTARRGWSHLSCSAAGSGEPAGADGMAGRSSHLKHAPTKSRRSTLRLDRRLIQNLAPIALQRLWAAVSTTRPESPCAVHRLAKRRPARCATIPALCPRAMVLRPRPSCPKAGSRPRRCGYAPLLLLLPGLGQSRSCRRYT